MVMNAERGGYALVDKQAEGYDEWSTAKITKKGQKELQCNDLN